LVHRTIKTETRRKADESIAPLGEETIRVTLLVLTFYNNGDISLL